MSAMDKVNENVLEWITGQRHITVTFSETKYVNKIKDLAKKFPKEVKILHENEDGSIVAHIPKSALKVSIIKREMSEEQRKAASERMKSLVKK